MASGGSRIQPVELVKNFGSKDSFNGSIFNALYWGIGGVVASVFMAFAIFIDVGQQLITKPLGRMATEIANLMGAIIGGASRIIDQAATTAVLSIAPGAKWAIGPLTYVISIAVMGAALYVLAQILESPVTSDTIPFTFSDLPVLGVEEDEE